MSLYSRICLVSSAVSLGTVGLLVWIASPTQAETGYIYFSLAAPTLALSHHVLYFLGPFTSTPTGSPVYALVPPSPDVNCDASPSGPATPTTTKFRISRICRKYGIGWKHLFLSEEELNPMASSTVSIIVLIFLAVLVGAFAISSGAVALLDVLDTVSAQKAADRLSALPTDNATSIDVPAPMSDYSGLDSTVPPTPILALQAGLSLMQAILLGSLAMVGMRIRSMQSSDSGSMADDESGLDIEWVYDDDECAEENK